MAFYLGCPVWGDKSWVGTFFPPGTRQKDFLPLYSQRLSTVEGNTSFYAVPTRETMTRWRDETPAGFQFCFKFPQVISHRKRLRDCAVETQQWIDLLHLLGDRAGPSFLQLPPSFAPDQLLVLADYLTTLPTDLRFAVEFRHPGWFIPENEPEIDRLLQGHSIARVLFDARGLRSAEPDDALTVEAQEQKPNVPVRMTRTASFTLIRYIAHPDVPANAQYLDEWADTIAGWLHEDEHTDIYLFLHHPDNFWAPSLCRDFYARLSQRTSLPELPPWSEPTEPSVMQTRMF